MPFSRQKLPDCLACRVAAGPLPAMGVRRGRSAVQKAPADPKASLPQSLRVMSEFCPWDSACWPEGSSLEHAHLLLLQPSKALVTAALCPAGILSDCAPGAEEARGLGRASSTQTSAEQPARVQTGHDSPARRSLFAAAAPFLDPDIQTSDFTFCHYAVKSSVDLNTQHGSSLHFTLSSLFLQSY